MSVATFFAVKEKEELMSIYKHRTDSLKKDTNVIIV